jgi:hypothetical protein
MVDAYSIGPIFKKGENDRLAAYLPSHGDEGLLAFIACIEEGDE